MERKILSIWQCSSVPSISSLFAVSAERKLLESILRRERRHLSARLSDKRRIRFSTFHVTRCGTALQMNSNPKSVAALLWSKKTIISRKFISAYPRKSIVTFSGKISRTDCRGSIDFHEIPKFQRWFASITWSQVQIDNIVLFRKKLLAKFRISEGSFRN